ncbi:hypothetical protein QX776_12065 [Alteromonadaceae bacterium BrNp21-10]|nr:hypothetical protein [Alteromonadaceae bacterium BrNp21-10]
MQLKNIGYALLSKLPLGYFDGNLHKLSTNSKGKVELLLANDNFKPWILIVSREHYHEALDKLPIVNQKEAKRLLALNYPETENFFSLNGVTENQTFFNHWTFASSIPNSFIYLPEGLLLARTLGNDNAICIEEKSGPARLYVAATMQGILSTKPTKILNSLARFCQSCGLKEQGVNKNIGAAELADTLSKGLLSLTIKDWLIFWRRPTRRLGFADIKHSVIAGIGCVIGYIIFSSAYLYWQDNQMQQQLQNGKVDVSEALEVQERLNRLEEQLQILSPVIAEFKSNTAIWRILLPLYSQAEFSNIRFENNRFILRGTTTKATDLLAKITLSIGVADAKFDLPVSFSRNRESFTISFRLQQPPPEVTHVGNS